MNAIRRSMLFAVAAAWLFAARPAAAYIEAPHSFGQVVAQSTNILLIRVEAVDKEKNLIIYRKVKDIKGVHNQEVIKHNIGRGGIRPGEWKPTMDWAEPGKIACMFHNGGLSETCVGNWWYQTSAGGEWWNHVHAEPFLLRSYAGPPEKLASIVPQMMEGKEVIVPCMIDGNKDDLHNRSAKIQRLKVSLKLQDYNPKRDFVGWGGEEFRRIQGMAGFSLMSALPRVDPDAQAISTVDLDGDGKLDLCLVGGGRVVILQNNGDSLGEVTLPGVFGARSAVWADWNGDGKPDLFLATAAGPRLFTNMGGTLKDDSSLLPLDGPWNLTAAAWLDYDGDGKPDLLLANGWHGLKLLKNVGAGKIAFADATKEMGLDEASIGSHRGESLTAADVDGDGRPDFLLGAGKGLLFLNQKTKFLEAKDAGIAFDPRRTGPVFGDFDGDGALDLFVPQKDGGKLFKNDGKGKFADVSAKAIPSTHGWVVSAAWGDFDNDGQPDLILGCFKGPNRFLRNKGDGTFEDATDKVGLEQKIFNTQAIAVGDFNNDGVLDFAFNNEGQDSCLLMGHTNMLGKKTPIALRLLGNDGVIGSRVRVLTKDGKQLASQQISGGDGRGGQQSPVARFVLEPGAYDVEVRYSSGTVRTTPVTVGPDPVRTSIDPNASAKKN